MVGWCTGPVALWGSCPLSFPVKCALKGSEPFTLVLYANQTLVHRGPIASLCAFVLGGEDANTAQTCSLPSESSQTVE